MPPILYIIVPCYNEENVLPITSEFFLNELECLISKGKISDKSRILFLDDGSKDSTWSIILNLSKKTNYIEGIKLSRNFGHQNNVLAGLMESKDKCDITISIDCDGQDDISTIEKMIDEYHNGNEIVYGVRSKRDTDSFFKRFTAELFYKILNVMGIEVIYNHADYRLISKKALAEFSNFHETNLYLRGLIPLVGFKSTCVYYERHERLSGKSHYPFSKMLSLAFDGITSLSIKPIRLIACFGGLVSLFSFLYMLFIIILKITNFNNTFVPGWSSIICVFCFISGIQILALGIIGEYIGKIYMEVKARPRYIIEDRCGKLN